MEELFMTDKQSTELILFSRFYEIQMAIDRTTDQATKVMLEEQKMELVKKIEKL